MLTREQAAIFLRRPCIEDATSACPRSKLSFAERKTSKNSLPLLLIGLPVFLLQRLFPICRLDSQQHAGVSVPHTKHRTEDVGHVPWQLN